MVSTAFTEFRKHSAAFLDKVENGETVIITRHGRPVAEMIPPASTFGVKSWKRPALRLKIKGVSLSKAVLAERVNGR